MKEIRKMMFLLILIDHKLMILFLKEANIYKILN